MDKYLDKQGLAAYSKKFRLYVDDYVWDCLSERVPDPPTTDGTYTLQVTVSSGEPTYSWVSISQGN